MGYFGLALGMTTVGTFLAPTIFSHLPSWTMYLFFAAELGLVFTSRLWMQRRPMNIALFTLFAILSGLTLFPILAVAGAMGGFALIAQALFATTAMFIAAAIVGSTTKVDLSGWGKFLLMAVVGLIVVSLLQIFFQSSMVELIASGVGIIVFAAFTAYDFQNLRNYPENMAMEAGLTLYLNFINLFISILRFMIALLGRKD